MRNLFLFLLVSFFWGCEETPFVGRLEKGSRQSDLQLRNSKGLLQEIPSGGISISADGPTEIILRWGRKNELVVYVPKHLVNPSDPWNFDLRAEEIDQPVDILGQATRSIKEVRRRIVYQTCQLPPFRCDPFDHHPISCRGQQQVEQEIETTEDRLRILFRSSNEGTAEFNGNRLLERIRWERAISGCY